jgi:very-short-patch-repair endonuclease
MAPKSLEKSCNIYSNIWSVRNALRPEEVSISNGSKFWFDCHTCLHDYQQRPCSKTKGAGCPYCAKANSILCGNLRCNFCLSKSCYIYKEIWSIKNELNPEQVAISGDSKKHWFDCFTCNHDYQQVPYNKTRGQDCPYCSIPVKKLCGNLNCKFCLKKSCYIYKDIWNSRNALCSEQVSISSHKKYWFNCELCQHDYQQRPSDKTNNNQGCPFCSNQKLCGNLNCKFCLKKSCYIYKDIWNSRNALNPEYVAISSNKKYLFDCHICKHTYHQTPHSKTNGAGCPTCKNKTERKVADYLKQIIVKFIKEFKFNDKKRYDFCIPEYKLIIEVDGDQHFRQVSNWNCPIQTLETDIQKTKIALENGYSVLRIYQPDILKDNIDWKACINENLKLREVPETIFKSSIPELYNNHLL